MNKLKYILLLAAIPVMVSAQTFTLSHAAEKRWHIREILNDTSVSQLAKNIYLDRDWKLNDQMFSLLTVLDSFYRSDYTKGFYFAVMAKSYVKSDAAYSEGLGYIGKNYTDNHLTDFLNFFVGKGKMPSSCMTWWAKIFMLEQSIEEDSNTDAKKLVAVLEEYDKKCNACSKEQLYALAEFKANVMMFDAIRTLMK